jgi:DNA-binding MarR family transcriptional regulator
MDRINRLLDNQNFPQLPRIMVKTMHLFMHKLDEQMQEATLNISMEQFAILNILETGEDLIQQDLADLMNKDKSAILRQLNKLQDRKLLARIPDPEDKRKKQIVITKQGLDLLSKARNIEQKVIETVLEGIEGEEMQQMYATLMKIQSNILKG